MKTLLIVLAIALSSPSKVYMGKIQKSVHVQATWSQSASTTIYTDSAVIVVHGIGTFCKGHDLYVYTPQYDRAYVNDCLGKMKFIK